eukprot:CAMPEP_0195070964 /NCGR_PEP_ID=MMETSP0448-20130528/14893_1 /TAXON_ID=66468 /ORGANISM="Heterocapsa triquestra, Strain CCMP 448" /LENGTH=220 /DNA_ID=CAMNT_0040102745 /DNA_START=391 /DNA_END=1055 /DNA_ORIENTATION=+
MMECCFGFTSVVVLGTMCKVMELSLTACAFVMRSTARTNRQHRQSSNEARCGLAGVGPQGQRQHHLKKHHILKKCHLLGWYCCAQSASGDAISPPRPHRRGLTVVARGQGTSSARPPLRQDPFGGLKGTEENEASQAHPRSSKGCAGEESDQPTLPVDDAGLIDDKRKRCASGAFAGWRHQVQAVFSKSKGVVNAADTMPATPPQAADTTAGTCFCSPLY